MNKSNERSDVYYGGEVEQYEIQRKGKLWENEEQAFTSLLNKITPIAIIDCPVGTGRWLDFYKATFGLQEIAVTGLDVSHDMLKKAAAKAESIGFPIRTLPVNIFSDSLPPFETDDGLVVSTRFLNWVHKSDLPAVINAFTSVNPKWIICSLRYRSGFSVVEKCRRFWAVYIRRARTISIHELEFFLCLLKEQGYHVVDEHSVEQLASTKLAYFLFEKDGLT